MQGFADFAMLRRRMERHLGLIAALLLGAAAAFFCFAMPSRLLAGGIETLGLPPALAGARLALAAVVGIAAGAATYYAFGLIDRPARPAAKAVAGGRAAQAAPVLRRADAHPDAPPRRPIFAGTDLGTPLDLVDPLPPRRVTQPTWSPEPDAYEPLPFPAEAARPEPAGRATAPIGAAATAAATEPAPSLPAMMARLEAGLARKALALAGAETNVTVLKREIRPIGGSLSDAVETLRQRTAARR